MGHCGRAGRLVPEQVPQGRGAQRRSGRQVPAPLCCSGLGGAGRSGRLGRAAPGVGDTRGGGGGRRGGRTRPWEEAGQVWPGRLVPAGRRLAPPRPTPTPSRDPAPLSPRRPLSHSSGPAPGSSQSPSPSPPCWSAAPSPASCAPRSSPGAPRVLRGGASRMPRC